LDLVRPAKKTSAIDWLTGDGQPRFRYSFKPSRGRLKSYFVVLGFNPGAAASGNIGDLPRHLVQIRFCSAGREDFRNFRSTPKSDHAANRAATHKEFVTTIKNESPFDQSPSSRPVELRTDQ